LLMVTQNGKVRLNEHLKGEGLTRPLVRCKERG